jgi:hypothetical protein
MVFMTMLYYRMQEFGRYECLTMLVTQGQLVYITHFQ